MRSELSADHFHNEDAAFAYVEARIWPDGTPTCPHCGVISQAGRLKGKSARPGLWKCYACRKQFTVRIGTIFESSHAPLHVWLQAFYLMCSSKKGISTRQLQRTFGGSMKTAWFLSHRIREAMAPASSAGPIGGSGKVVEADETFLTRSVRSRPVVGRPRAILSLVERGAGVRSMPLRSDPNAAEIMTALFKHVDRKTELHTDGAQHYRTTLAVAKHETVNHSAKEWTRGDVHTQSVENYFSVFKRGLIGVYQHMSEQHLARYCHEFDFRYSNRAKLGIDDVQRAEIALQGAKGKRLTYETTRQRSEAATPRVPLLPAPDRI